MSHFSVLLVTKELPTEEVISREMQPFHEFECTGVDDQYVQDLDVTEENRREYETDQVLRLKDTEGQLHSPWDDQFYRDPTPEESKIIGPLAGTGGGHGLSWTSKDWGDGRGYRTKVRFVPDGWTEVKVPFTEIMSFLEYLTDWHGMKATTNPNTKKDEKYGYVLLDSNGHVVKVIRRTNPNDKWDCWQIGGRYTGKLQGLFGVQAKPSWEWEGEQLPKGLDVCQKKHLDVELMKRTAVAGRRNWIAEIVSDAGLLPEEINEAVWQSARGYAEWLTLEEPRPRGREFHDWMVERGYPLGAKWRQATFDPPKIPDGQPVGEWCQAAPYLTSFAFLRDGKWAAEGDMGFWACVSNAREDWQEVFQRLVDEVPDDHWLTILDCHC